MINSRQDINKTDRVRILFDHQTFSIQRYGGISRYFVNLSNQLNQLDGVSSSIATLYTDNEYLKNQGIPLNNAFGKKLFACHFNRIYRWNRRYCNLKIRINNFDVFHPTYYDPYFIYELKKPFVITVHDMIHELMPNQFADNDQVVKQKQILIEKADAIIAISEHTKKDIMRFYPGAANKITVIYHGLDLSAGQPEVTYNKSNFILFVGERVAYKNFTTMVKAIAPLLNQNKQLKLICAGGGKFTPTEHDLFLKLNITNQCEQVNATDATLQQLYQQALLFVFPSLYEGFGIPLLEAFKAGCPIAASNNTCFPEIGGDALAYFDPEQTDSIYQTIKLVLTDDALRNAYINKGMQRLTLFSIQTQAQQTLQLYKRVAGK